MNNQVIILCSKNKCDLLKRNIPYITKNLPADKFYIITSQENFEILSFINFYDNVFLIDEDNVIDGLTFNTVFNLLVKTARENNNTGWYFQQFLKMAWAKNPLATEYYTVWDCDTFPLQKIDFFWNNKICVNLKNEYYEPYFKTIEELLHLKKQIKSSFISEFMTINKSQMIKLIDKIQTKKKPFYELILETVEKTSDSTHGFSEFETFGSFVFSQEPDSITFNTLSTYRNGSSLCGMTPTKFNLDFLSKRYDTVSFETWSKQNLMKIIIFNIYSFFQYILKR